MKRLCSVLQLALLVLAAQDVLAASRMVGITPADGTAMLVKRFAVPAGTTILGIEFVNNDPGSVFPEVVLVRDAVEAVRDGIRLARAYDVRETAPGRVLVMWDPGIAIDSDCTCFVGVCVAAGSRRVGTGIGSALGANDVPVPSGSFVAAGPEGRLVPILVDLSISLLTDGRGSDQASPQKSRGTEPPGERQPSLRLLHSGPSSVRMQYQLESGARVRLAVYDVRGRLVRELLDAGSGPGTFECTWDWTDGDGARVSAGVYYVRLEAGGAKTARPVLLIR